MADYVDPLENPQKNRYGTAGLILGALSVAFAQFCHAPGIFSVVGCLGPILALAAAVMGVVAIRKARDLGGTGQKPAIGGLATAMIGLFLFLIRFIPVMLIPGGALAQLSPPTPAVTSRPTMTPTPTPTPTATPLPTNTPAPVTYRGRGFAITFTDEWLTVDAESDSRGEYLVLRHIQDPIQLHVYRQTLSGPPDLETDVASFISNNFGTPDIIAEGEIKVSGRTGVTKRFVSDAAGSGSHVLLAAVTAGNDLYTFLVLAPSEEELALYETKTLEIIGSTEITSAQPTARPTTPSTSELQPYEGDGFSLAYPGDWVQIDASGAGFCQYDNVSCFVIEHPDTTGPEFLLVRQAQEEPPDLEALDQDIWDDYSSAAELVTVEDTTVGGEPAIKRVFSVPGADTPTGKLYASQVIVVHGNASYQILMNTASAEDMMRHQATFEAIIASIEFTE
jgi:hypothetical protein